MGRYEESLKVFERLYKVSNKTAGIFTASCASLITRGREQVAK